MAGAGILMSSKSGRTLSSLAGCGAAGAGGIGGGLNGGLAGCAPAFGLGAGGLGKAGRRALSGFLARSAAALPAGKAGG